MTKQIHRDSAAVQEAPRFGTFLGVYTPSVLTILGLIMYLRFGWVVGNVGLPLTVLIVLVSSSITFITALSASAVATNMTVGVGGEYYMISRSLGLELGGAIGIPLYLCRTLSITFYSFGLSESIFSFWPMEWGSIPGFLSPLLTSLIIVTITVVSGKSAAIALKLQIPIMIIVGLSLVALMAGVFSAPFRTPEFVATYRTAPEGFWYVFAVFFPAVTGFTAGIGMSGDLINPRKSIPRGTMLAVVSGTLIYLIIPILLGITSRVSPEELAEPVIIWIKISILGGWLIFPAVWGAILSSAFGSVLGGPRVLQALAKDGLAPKFLARLSKTGQPTVATWISGAIAVGAVALGGLNTVAQFVTVLFLTLYVTVNLSAATENLSGDPSYRPTINVPWYVSLIGSIGAIVVMFLINPVACIIAICLEFLLFAYLRRRSMERRWGDVRAGAWMALARFALIQLGKQTMDHRNWRPHILLFAGDAVKRSSLVRLASWFSQNRGIVTVSRFIVGDLKEQSQAARAKQEEIDATLRAEGLVAFSEVSVVSNFENGVLDTVQANGFSSLNSNTVMFGWSRKKERLESQLRIMQAISRAGKCTIIAKILWAHEPGQQKRIDVWWGGLQRNGDLMLLLAYLLNLNADWNDARITVRAIAKDEKERRSQLTSLDGMLSEVRIPAEVEVILKPEGKSIPEIVREHSHQADVVFLGMREPKPGTEADYADRLIELSQNLKTTIFVRNAGEFAGNLI